jgi:hypothetical protein
MDAHGVGIKAQAPSGGWPPASLDPQHLTRPAQNTPETKEKQQQQALDRPRPFMDDQQEQE